MILTNYDLGIHAHDYSDEKLLILFKCKEITVKFVTIIFIEPIYEYDATQDNIDKIIIKI